ncbi:MAG: hypothetical protein EBU93_06105, partial [Chlamydiae bacterium]|nr:hypothetical protein [Chlamydiota bacterium]
VESLRFFTPHIALTTVRQFLLFASNENFDQELSRFGVSDAVLDGVLSACQFVKIQSPMHINQVYLMHSFARGCGLILANGAVGADLLFPVLRTDNKMSCIVFQIKNVQNSNFPNNEIDVVEKLSKEKLDYLNFNKIGKFEDAPVDDFLRIVIQFGLEENQSRTRTHHWSQIPGSSCQVLWLNGLKALGHCFFDDEDILYLLNVILSGRRDFYSNLNYPRYPLPTYLQSTEEGARFLGRLARPLGNFANLTPFGPQLREESFDLGHYEWKCAKENLKFLQMSENAFDHFREAEFSPEGPDHTPEELCKRPKAIGCSTVNAPQTDNTHRSILEKIVTICKTPNTGAKEYMNDFSIYKEHIKAIPTHNTRVKNNKMEHLKAVGIRIKSLFEPNPISREIVKTYQSQVVFTESEFKAAAQIKTRSKRMLIQEDDEKAPFKRASTRKKN